MAPLEVRKRCEKWKDAGEISSPSGVMLIRGFLDEALRGKGKGYRSSSLNLHYRVINQTEGDRFDVYALEVTPHALRTNGEIGEP